MKRCPNHGRFDEAITEIKTAIDLDLALWKDADTDIPILIEAKKEYEKLQ